MLYKDYRPTPLDRYIEVEGKDEWLVLPVGKSRDSGPLEESNFEAALALFGGEGELVEILSFGHWAVGWFAIIVVDPSRREEVEALEQKLEDYSVLDEEDFSAREDEDAQERWEGLGVDERAKILKSLGIDPAKAEADHYNAADASGSLADYLRTP